MQRQMIAAGAPVAAANTRLWGRMEDIMEMGAD